MTSNYLWFIDIHRYTCPYIHRLNILNNRTDYKVLEHSKFTFVIFCKAKLKVTFAKKLYLKNKMFSNKLSSIYFNFAPRRESLMFCKTARLSKVKRFQVITCDDFVGRLNSLFKSAWKTLKCESTIRYYFYGPLK